MTDDNVVGSASVRITAEVEPGTFEASINRAIEQATKDLKARFEAELHLTVGSLAPAQGNAKGPVSEAGPDGKGKLNSVVADADGVNIKGSVKINVDVANVGSQLQTYFNAHIFKIKVQLDNVAGNALSLDHIATDASQRSSSAAGPTQQVDLRQLQAKIAGLKDGATNVNKLYEVLHEGMASVGKSFGAIPIGQPGREAERLLEIASTFGGDMTKWVEITQRTTGAASVKGGTIGAALEGLDRKVLRPILSAAATVVGSQGAEGQGSYRHAAVLQPILREALAQTPPPVQQPAGAADPVVQRLMERLNIADKAGDAERVRTITQQLSARGINTGGVSGQQQTGFASIDLEKMVSDIVSGTGPRTPSGTPGALELAREAAEQAKARLAAETNASIISGVRAGAPLNLSGLTGLEDLPGGTPGTRNQEGTIVGQRTVNPERVAELERERRSLKGKVGASRRLFLQAREEEFAGRGLPVPEQLDIDTDPNFAQVGLRGGVKTIGAALDRIREIDRLLNAATNGETRRPADPDSFEGVGTGSDPARQRGRRNRGNRGEVNTFGPAVNGVRELVHVDEGFGPRRPGAGIVIPASLRATDEDEAEADRAAQAQLGLGRTAGGNSRRGSSSRSTNVRGPRGRGVFSVPGIGDIDIEGLLREVESGGLRNLAEIISGPDKDKVVPLSAETPELLQRLLHDAGRGGFTVAGGQRVKRIDPSEAIKRIVTESIAPHLSSQSNPREITDELFARPDVAATVSKALERGASPINASRGIEQLASDPSRGGKALIELHEVLSQLERKNRRRYSIQDELDNPETTDKRAGVLERRLAKLESDSVPLRARAHELAEIAPRGGFRPTSAFDARYSNALDEQFGEENRARLDEGYGLNEAEKAKREIDKRRHAGYRYDPNAKPGEALFKPITASYADQELAAKVGSGALPDVHQIVEDAYARLRDPGFQSQIRVGSGKDGKDLDERNYAALSRLVGEGLDDAGLQLHGKRLVDPEERYSKQELKQLSDQLATSKSARVNDIATHDLYAQQTLDAQDSARHARRAPHVDSEAVRAEALRSPEVAAMERRIAEIDKRRSEIERTESVRIAEKHGLTTGRVGDAPGDAELLLSGTPLPTRTLETARTSFRRSFAQSNAGNEYRALGEERKDLDFQKDALKAQLESTHNTAMELIRGVSGQNPLQGPDLATGRPVPGGDTRPTMTPAEVVAAISARPGVSDEVKTEVSRLFSTGAAPGYAQEDALRRRGVSQVPGVTGAESRLRYAQEGGILTGPLEPGEGGRGDGRGRGRVGGFDGHDGGTIHVIIAGQTAPVAVTMENWSGHASYAASGRTVGEPVSSRNPESVAATAAANTAAKEAEAKAKASEIIDDGSPTGTTRGKRRKRINARDVGTASDLGAIYTFDPTEDEAPSGRSAREEAAAARTREAAYTTHQDRMDALEKAQDRDAMRKAERADAASEKFNADPKAQAAASRARRRQAVGLDPIINDITTDEANEGDDERARLARTSNAANRRILRRGFTASVTDVLQAPFFEKQVEALNHFNREAGQLGGLLDRQARATVSVGEAEKELSLARQKGLPDLEDYVKGHEAEVRNLANIRGQVARQRTRTAEAESNLPGGGAALGNLAVGGIAAAGAFGLGSVVFQIAGQVLGMVEQGITQAIAPTLERMSGFTGTEARITSANAGLLAQSGGNAGAIAGAAASTGISAEQFASIGGVLTTRAQVEQGNQALSAQLDMLHGFESATRQGADQGIFSTTGGFLGTSLGGTASTQELFKNEVSAAETVAPGAIYNQRPEDVAAATGEGSYGPSNFGAPSSSFDKLAQDRMRIGQGLPPINGANGQALPVHPDSFYTTPANQGAIDKAEGLLADRLKFWNDAMQKGGESVNRFASHQDAAAESFAKAAEKAGLTEVASAARGPNHVVLVGEDGQPVLDPTKIQQAFLSANLGAQTPDPELVVRSQQRAIQAKIGLENQQRDFSIGTVIPQQAAIGQAISPLGDLTAPLKAMGVNNLGELPGLLKTINAETKTGTDEAKDFVTTTLGSATGAQFASSLEAASKYGQEISKTQIGVQTEQAALGAAQYSFQISQATRSLSDAKGLTGQITDENGRNLGVIERETFELQKQSQQLSFQMTQRQINYQVALAGFVAPGVTSEERGARIEEAKKEAEYAQKQLDIQEKLAGLGNKSFQITAARSVTDLTRQLGLLERGRTVELDTAKAEAKIRALTVLQDKENKKVETYYNAAVQRTGDVMELAAQLVEATGAGLNRVTRLALNAFEVVYTGIISAVEGGGTNSRSTGVSHQGSAHNNARGILATTSGAYNMTIGEAGDETVAVLRNPRPGSAAGLSPFGGGGGGINVGGITVIVPASTSRGDAEQLAKVITRMVEENLSRRLTLLGGHKALA